MNPRFKVVSFASAPAEDAFLSRFSRQRSGSTIKTDPDLLQARVRQQMVARRRSLDDGFCRKVATRLAAVVADEPWFLHAGRLACYLPMSGEADPREIARRALDARKSVYVPVIAGRTLMFRAWQPDSELAPNRYGIAEPTAGDELEPGELDLAFTPLVAFDDAGNRVGMGSGFYDRTFAFLTEVSPRRPRLIGVAYEFQRQPHIEPQPWDVPLDAVVTEAGLQRFDREDP